MYLLPLLLVLVNYLSNVRSYVIRPANDHDTSVARRILVQQAMNPLSLSTKHLLVACQDNNEELVLGFGQIRPLDATCSELASLYVQTEHRSQGIGSAMVKALLDRHYENEEPQSRICLLTLKSTTKFYRQFGFREADKEERRQLPKALQVEYQLGSVLSFVLGNDLVCMVKDESESTSDEVCIERSKSP
jgi:N-acetylglutamate synthase-like GNAT family acetyltransferase